MSRVNQHLHPEEFEDQAKNTLDPEVQQKLEWLSPNQHRHCPLRHQGRRTGGNALTGKALVGKITNGKITNGKITNGEFADFFQGVSLRGNSDSLVSDWLYTEHLTARKCLSVLSVFEVYCTCDTCTIRACG